MDLTRPPTPQKTDQVSSKMNCGRKKRAVEGRAAKRQKKEEEGGVEVMQDLRTERKRQNEEERLSAPSDLRGTARLI